MTRQDRTMLLGCVVVALLAAISLSGKPLSSPAHANPSIVISKPAALQSARVHSLAGASARAVSLF